MGHQRFDRPWDRVGGPGSDEGGAWRQHRERGDRGERGERGDRGDRGERGRGRGRGAGPWGEFGPGFGGFGGGFGGRQGPPPWMTGLFGLGQGPEQRRGPRVRRGDVRSAILDVLRAAAETGEPVNGYQVIQQIAERSGGAWRPSPGSVYPTVQLLQDEGLVETDDQRSRKSLALTAEGTAYVAEHAAELAAVWAPFEREDRDVRGTGFGELKPEIGQVMGAVWQIVTAGSAAQQRAAVDVLVETRRKLYGILADGHEPEAEEDDRADQSLDADS